MGREGERERERERQTEGEKTKRKTRKAEIMTVNYVLYIRPCSPVL